MHPYRIILLLLAALVIGFGYYGMQKGTINIKGITYDRDMQPFGFWASVLIMFGFGIMLIYFAIFGKITQ